MSGAADLMRTYINTQRLWDELCSDRCVWETWKGLIGAELIYDESLWPIRSEKGRGVGGGGQKGDARVVLMTEEGTLKEKER